jgi:Transposase
MVERASTLIEEISQIRLQYVAEVGKGRRVWPKSIKARIAELDELGLPAKGIAERTGVPYETIILWRYKRRREQDASGFHELKVAAPQLPGISKSVAVTATKTEISPVPLAVTTPEGYRIEGLTEASLLRLIGRLRGCVSHAS